MDTRRYLNELRSRTLAQFRWLGWVMLMMFVLVQVAMGASPLGSRTDTFSQESGTSDQASANFNPETGQVIVTANVPAAEWAATADIGRHSFVVYEDNVRQLVDDVRVTHAPLSIGLLLENGGRYHALNEVIAENVTRAARELLGAINPGDRVTMWTYSDSVQPLETVGNDTSGLQQANLSLPVPPASESNFYDALVATLPRVEEMPGRKILMVVTSGIDTFSKAGFADVLRAEREAGVPVCVIDTGPLLRSSLLDENSGPYAHLKWSRASSQLERIAKVSGCRALAPRSSLEFPAVYDNLLANLGLQYDIRYKSNALDLPGPRQVKLAWVDGDGKELGLTQHTVKHEREFARAQYAPPAVTKFVSSQVPEWPLLRLAAGDMIQVPLSAAAGTEAQSSALLAAAAGSTDIPRGELLD
jgi:hypothetical protein